MRQKSGDLAVATTGCGLFEVTEGISNWVRDSGISEGMLTVFIQHTSASLTVQENADPDVQLDMLEFYRNIAPENLRLYRHGAEGPDDMPSHIRSSLTDVSLNIPILSAGMRLGTWQGIYVFEHRARPHLRNLALHIIGV